MLSTKPFIRTKTSNCFQIFAFLAGLTNPSSTRPRRYSSEDLDRTSSVIVQSNNQNVEELQQIIHNQNKYIQQLQIRIRIHAPDVVQNSRPDRLIEENQVRHFQMHFKPNQ